LRDANGIPIGVANDNPILDTRVYEGEYMDGRKASLAANAIATNTFAQIDDDGNRFVLLDSIVDHRTDGTELQHDDAFVTSRNGGRRRKMTTKGWEILLQWKDGSTTWEKMKDVKMHTQYNWPNTLGSVTFWKHQRSPGGYHMLLRKGRELFLKFRSYNNCYYSSSEPVTDEEDDL